MVVTPPGVVHITCVQGLLKWNKSSVCDGSFLEFNPGSLILQKSTSLEQKTLIDNTENAEVLYFEKILPGRLAYGESFEFSKFVNRLRIKKDKQLILLENFILDPNESVYPWRNSFESPSMVVYILLHQKWLKCFLVVRQFTT